MSEEHNILLVDVKESQISTSPKSEDVEIQIETKLLRRKLLKNTLKKIQN